MAREGRAGEARGQLDDLDGGAKEGGQGAPWQVMGERAGGAGAILPLLRARRGGEQENGGRGDGDPPRPLAYIDPSAGERDPTGGREGGREDAPADARAPDHVAVVRALDLLGRRHAAARHDLVGLLLLDGEALLLLLLEAREVVLALLRDHVARDDVGAHAERLRVVRLPRAVAARRDVAVTCGFEGARSVIVSSLSR